VTFRWVSRPLETRSTIFHDPCYVFLPQTRWSVSKGIWRLFAWLIGHFVVVGWVGEGGKGRENG